MCKLSIVTAESAQNISKSILKARSTEVKFPLTTEIQSLISNMKKHLFQVEGVGLAANQVNSSHRIALVYIPESAALLRNNANAHDMFVMINPSYKAVNEALIESDFEGCYSVTSIMGKVKRYEAIHLSYYDENGNFHQCIETGFFARVLQHEIDHLDGILITDRLTQDCIQGHPTEILKLRRDSLDSKQKEAFDKLIVKKNIHEE